MDFYIVLGLERTASLGDVKRAYRRLARRYHPDINPGDRMAAAQFRRILEAYETLSDPERRRRYDVVGVAQAPPEPDTFGFQGFDFSVSVSGPPASTFGDLFGEILKARGPRRDRRAPERGTDLHQTLTIGFEDAMRGGAHEVTVVRAESCPACRGSGRVQTAESRCLTCQGTGSVTSARGHMVFSKPCAHCDGTGRRADVVCPRCDGQHSQLRSETIRVNLPPGLADGARIRVPGQGHAGRLGGEAGDLYVTVRVEPHRLFRREGDDLCVSVPIAIHEAALGAKIDIPGIDGLARLRVPPGTQTGQRFRLRERGAVSARDGTRGDLVVDVRVVLPQVLDERSKDLLREFGRINSQDVRKDAWDPAVAESQRNVP